MADADQVIPMDEADGVCTITLAMCAGNPSRAADVLLTAWLSMAHSPSLGKDGQALALNTGVRSLNQAVQEWNARQHPPVH